MSLDVHVIAHTHWDREWYQPLERFRQRLVELIDELLDDQPGAGASFLLDGQAIILEDYLAVRPERAKLLGEALSRGAIEAGPWYVLGDELIPSGEALVRNLFAGRRVLSRLGADPPPVLYSPDSFGHPAALPAIACGFGLELVILWRGYGSSRWPRGDMAKWKAPTGDAVAVYHLPKSGYEFGSSLPVAIDESRERWRTMRAELVSRSSTGIVLVTSGADHHARQENYDGAIESLRRVASTDKIHISSLRAFARAVKTKAGAHPLPLVQGELRDSYGFTWTLQGTLATRASQKRRNAEAERLLLTEAEPWSAMVRLAGGRSRLASTRAAWASLLTAHPHDTLCGCSIDEVAAAADVRIAAARAQALGIRDDSLADMLGHDPDEAWARREEWMPRVVVRNSVPWSRGGVLIADVAELVADEPVGPGSRRPATTPSLESRAVPFLKGARGAQLLDRHVGRDRIEARRHYPDNDLVIRSRIATWIETVPPYGLSSYLIAADAPKHAAIPNRVKAGERSLDNGLVGVAVDGTGAISLTDYTTGTTIAELIVLETATDRGDLYTPSIGDAVEHETVAKSIVKHGGPLVGELVAQFETRYPEPGGRRAAIEAVELSVILHANSPLIRIAVCGIRGANAPHDHRLRVGISTGIAGAEVWADAAFGAVQRKPIEIAPEDARMETPPPTAPLQRYVSLFAGARGATVFSDGLAEYEARSDGRVFLTLVRAVGELSRNDIAERPGHAGWPVATPAAQSQGPFAADVALLMHGGRSPQTIHQVERAASDALVPLVGSTVRNALEIPGIISGIELVGTALASSTIKESEDGDHVVLRCVNLSDQTQEGTWTLPVPVEKAWTARLDETKDAPLPVAGHTIQFRARPREIVTILLPVNESDAVESG